VNPPLHAPGCDLRQILRRAGLRPTEKRLELGALVLCGPHRHFSAEQVWREATERGCSISLATVYNTLNGFASAGLLRQVDLPTAAGLFDSNTTPHHHLLAEDTGAVYDLPLDSIRVTLDPASVPPGLAVHGIDIVVRVRGPGPS
jgi:Fur family transcriptional regulator, iron response regulator